MHVEQGLALMISGSDIRNNATGNGANGTDLSHGGNGGNGGGILFAGSTSVLSPPLRIINSRITGNTTGVGGNTTGTRRAGNAGRGGGIYNEGGLRIIDCQVNENATGNGGDAEGTGDGGDGGDGAGIFNDGGRLMLEDSTVHGNSCGAGGDGSFDGSAGQGGGIDNSGGTSTLTNSTISANSAGSAGGINHSDGTFALTNSTVSGNSSSIVGAGIVNTGNMFVIWSSTITGNSAASNSGGLANFARLEIQNSILAGNSGAGIFPDVRSDDPNEFRSRGHNLIGNEDGVGFTPAIGDQIGTSASPIDPRLGALAFNGGPTRTHALLPFSPAIDAGVDAGSTGEDQRGLPRPIDLPGISIAAGGDGSDIGAFEAQRDADLKVLKIGTPFDDGDGITYSIVVDNLGPGFGMGVAFQEELISSRRFNIVSIDPDVNDTFGGAAFCTIDAPNDGIQNADPPLEAIDRRATITCELVEFLPTLEAGVQGRWVVEVVVTACHAQRISNFVDVTSDSLDPDAGNNISIVENDLTRAHGFDGDGDGTSDICDNCSLVANPSQTDTDDDGYGNACDPDLNQDCVVGMVDLEALLGCEQPVCDADGDGGVGAAETGSLVNLFGGPPGPSAIGTCP